MCLASMPLNTPSDRLSSPQVSSFYVPVSMYMSDMPTYDYEVMYK